MQFFVDLMYTETMETIEIGRISACIRADRDYTTILVVLLREDGMVELVGSETVPGGGMDMRNGRQTRVTLRDVMPANPKVVLKAIKQFIASPDGDTIRIYGKPTKNFTWRSVGKGLSLAVVTKALADD